MNKKTIGGAALALGLAAANMGCAGVGQCSFAKGEIPPTLSGEGRAFVETVMELKKLQLQWDAEIKAMAGELGVTGGEEAVLAKLQANFTKLKAEGKCTFDLSADIDLKAQLSASAGGSASTSSGAKGSAAGSGSSFGKVDVKIDAKCQAEAAVKADLDVTVKTLKAHMPTLFTVAKGHITFLAKVPELKAKGEAALKASLTDFNTAAEVKCAIETLTGFKASAEGKVDFSVKVQASAKGEAKAGT